MANIDRYLEPLKKPGAQAITFRTGSPVELRINGESKALTKSEFTTGQVMSVLTEILPESFQGEIDGMAKDYNYDSPVGAVKLTVIVKGEKISARIMFGMAEEDEVEEALDEGAEEPRYEEQLQDDVSEEEINEEKPNHREVEWKIKNAIDKLFHHMLDIGASDLHLKSGLKPMIRQDGDMAFLEGTEELSQEALFELLKPIMPQKNVDEFEKIKDTDFAYEVGSRARMRANMFMDLAGVGAVFRQIPAEILTVEQLGVPDAAIKFCDNTKGLILVTGPTGSGKSTTLAALIDYINTNRSDHIITIEDPVEFVHPQKKCLVNQREVGTTTMSFKNALRAALREDPDIVLLGELRDLETTEIAIETAETGHLVFGTLHTNTAASTIDRMIDQFPVDRQGQVRAMLSTSLIGVVSQILCKKVGGGRIAVLEILVATSAVANLIREGKTFQIPSIMQTARNVGMQTMNDVLANFVKDNKVSPEEAYLKAADKQAILASMRKHGIEFEPE